MIKMMPNNVAKKVKKNHTKLEKLIPNNERINPKIISDLFVDLSNFFLNPLKVKKMPIKNITIPKKHNKRRKKLTLGIKQMLPKIIKIKDKNN